jgi:hypothetical protein
LILDEHDEIANQLYQPIDDAVPDATVWQEVSPGYRAEANCIQYEEPPQTLDEIARCRYGIQIRDGPYTRLPLPERMDWDKAMRIMGEENRQVQDTRLEDAILDMLQWLINIDRLGASNPPASLWDLHPNNHQYLFGRQDAISTVTVKYTNEDKVYLIQISYILGEIRSGVWYCQTQLLHLNVYVEDGVHIIAISPYNCFYEDVRLAQE